jgi:hypothetical protein
MKTIYYTVAMIPSSSKRGKFWAVKRNIQTGQLSCSCPAWIFQRGPAVDRKPCKHVIKAMQLGFQEQPTQLSLS